MASGIIGLILQDARNGLLNINSVRSAALSPTRRSSLPALDGMTLQLFQGQGQGQGQDREPHLDVPGNGVDLASSGSLSSQPRISIRSVRSIDMISAAPARLAATERAIVNE